MSDRRVAALVINWNGANDTLHLLDSLEAARSSGISIEVVVIDNNSDPADRLELESGIGERAGRLHIHYRRNAANVGVPAAYNQAVQVAGLDFDYYLRLDNDVVLEPTAIARLIDACERNSHSDVGLVGCHVALYAPPHDPNGGATSIDLVRGKTSVCYPSSEVLCDGVLGCVMLVTQDVVCRYVPEVFESRLFLCTDESELSLRCKRDGISTLYHPALLAYHKGGRSTRKVPFMATYFSARNWTVLRLRHTTGLQRWSVLMHSAYGCLASLIRLRMAFPLGMTSGLLLSAADAIDGWVTSRRRPRR